MKRFLVLAMRRPEFDDAVIAPHRAFLDDLRAAGRLELAGGFADRTGGAYLLRGIETLDEARRLVATDPLVTARASDLTVFEWNAG